MRFGEYKNHKQVIIDPGEYYVSKDDIVISTLLGSCVAACLFDPVNRVIGMNHFLLAYKRFGSKENILQSEVGRYGIHSMELLINTMLKKGAKRNHIKAKAFGGGNVLQNMNSDQESFFMVGTINSEFIVHFLEDEGIPLVSSDLGGSYGRTIHFMAHDQSVYMRRISHNRDADLANEERRYWDKNIKEQEKEKSQPKIVFWD